MNKIAPWKVNVNDETIDISRTDGSSYEVGNRAFKVLKSETIADGLEQFDWIKLIAIVIPKEEAAQVIIITYESLSKQQLDELASKFLVKAKVTVISLKKHISCRIPCDEKKDVKCICSVTFDHAIVIDVDIVHSGCLIYAKISNTEYIYFETNKCCPESR